MIIRRLPGIRPRLQRAGPASFSLLVKVVARRCDMPPGVDHALHALAFAPHAKLGLGWTPAGPENLLIVIGAYVIVLLVLVIFGVLGFHSKKSGGNGGGGGGGPKRPPGRDLPPPNGRELRPDDPPGLIEDDFAAWERQLQSSDSSDHQEDLPTGQPGRR
jgi:hypothetical protein